MDMTRSRTRIAKTGLTFAIVLAPVLGFLLWPIRTDNTIMQPDPALLPGKQSYLASTKANTGAPHPNVVVLLADDLGEFDISLYGGKDVRTPHIDSLARSGVTFTDGYCTSPICSPSRAGLLTGRYQQRFGHELQPGDAYPGSRFEILLGNRLVFTKEWKLNAPRRYPSRASMNAQGLRQSEITFAEMAKTQGYATGAIGKWHLGHAQGLTPRERGFDYYYGFLAAASLYSPLEAPDIICHRHSNVVDLALRFMRRRGNHAIQRNGQIIQEMDYLTEKIAQEAVGFIERNKNKPFLLYVPFNAPHEPFQVPTRYYERFKEVQDTNKRTYYAMISALDDAVGAIVKKVRDAGLEEKTLFVFASDNGGATYTLATTNGPLKGGKLSQFEGGINVPFLMSWKGTIPPNTVCREPVSTLDVFTTIAANIHAPLPQDRVYDGVDLISKVLKHERAHEALFWRSGTSKAVRKGDWKLVISERSARIWLYDLATDKSETTDLSQRKPEVVAELQAALKEWEKGLVAPLWPSPARNEQRFGDDLYIFDM
jgi:arylsulfatase A-like enzyme